MNIKRAKYSGLIAIILTAVGFIIASPHWSAFKGALPCGVLSGLLVISGLKNGKRNLGPFSVMPLIVAYLLSAKSIKPELEGLPLLGYTLQFIGLGFSCVVGVISIYLLRHNEKPAYQALEPANAAITPPADAGDRTSGTRGSP